jgi:hypothetical protein
MVLWVRVKAPDMPLTIAPTVVLIVALLIYLRGKRPKGSK